MASDPAGINLPKNQSPLRTDTTRSTLKIVNVQHNNTISDKNIHEKESSRLSDDVKMKP